MKMDDAEHRIWAVKMTRSMPGYPWLPCPICIRDGFKGVGGCDHTARERAEASGISFGNDTMQ